jgi:hypothetical protein
VRIGRDRPRLSENSIFEGAAFSRAKQRKGHAPRRACDQTETTFRVKRALALHRNRLPRRRRMRTRRDPRRVQMERSLAHNGSPEIRPSHARLRVSAASAVYCELADEKVPKAAWETDRTTKGPPSARAFP